MSYRFAAKPYKLFNPIKHYEWGTKNENAFIPHFLHIPAEFNTPYAELWIGAHPQASSEIIVDDKRVSLSAVVREFPLECLGEKVRKQFNGSFPYLLKILSAAHALSIQAHPNKSQAQLLHKNDPDHYPDENHKPEIAIALDSLQALVGFSSVEGIKKNVRHLPELKLLIGSELIEEFLSSSDPKKDREGIKNIYEAMMRCSEEKEKLHACIEGIHHRLAARQECSAEEALFENQYRVFGVDVGLLSIFFFRSIDLKSGEAIFTDAGVPHAYIQGTICECMANSDNVVRAGLTEKYKDVQTLLDIIQYNFSESPMIVPTQTDGCTIYKTPSVEFEVSTYTSHTKESRRIFSNNKPCIYLLMNGDVSVQWSENNRNESVRFSSGESFFIPANLQEYTITAEVNTEYFCVNIPEQ